VASERTSAADRALRVTRGSCHVYFAFDVAHEIDLEACVRRLRDPARRVRIEHTRRAPSYFQFEPAPVRVRQEGKALVVDSHTVSASVEAVLYDFGAVSVGYAVPFEGSLDDLARLSCALHESEPLRQDAALRVAQILEALGDAARQPGIADLTEDYLVFQIGACDASEPVGLLASRHAADIARVLRAEPGVLSEQEVADAVAGPVSYGTDDVCLVDWNAALVFAPEAEDVRAVLEFANVQLAETRFLDATLDASLDRAYAGLTARRTRPGFRRVRPELRRVARMQVDGAILFERVSNALKLLGDPYLARVYLQATRRFRLAEWNAGILRKLDALESIYDKLSDEASTARMEMLEWIIVLLIALSIVLSFVPGVGH
jgi:hypothetical protein